MLDENTLSVTLLVATAATALAPGDAVETHRREVLGINPYILVPVPGRHVASISSSMTSGCVASDAVRHPPSVGERMAIPGGAAEPGAGPRGTELCVNTDTTPLGERTQVCALVAMQKLAALPDDFAGRGIRRIREVPYSHASVTQRTLGAHFRVADCACRRSSSPAGSILPMPSTPTT